jgi:glycosyltransferase involved in cell wall biosynthesis
MSRAPAVSVIMPCLDMERYIRDSIDSVLAQTYASWELLVVDDGSTDASRGIAGEYARRDSRIRVLRQEGGSRGASAARNLGLRHAHGEFIALLDADDVWLPNKLEDQLELLQAHPGIDVLYGRTLWWYSWAESPAEADMLPQLGVRPRPTDGAALLEKMIRNAAAVPTTCSVLLRRDAVEATGGFEDEFRYIYTDQVFFAKLLLRTTALPVDRCWDRYRRRRDSSSSLDARQLVKARLRYLEWLARYIEQLESPRPALLRAVQREMRWVRSPAAVQRVRRTINRLPGRADVLLRRLGLRRS